MGMAEGFVGNVEMAALFAAIGHGPSKAKRRLAVFTGLSRFDLTIYVHGSSLFHFPAGSSISVLAEAELRAAEEA